MDLVKKIDDHFNNQLDKIVGKEEAKFGTKYWDCLQNIVRKSQHALNLLEQSQQVFTFRFFFVISGLKHHDFNAFPL